MTSTVREVSKRCTVRVSSTVADVEITNTSHESSIDGVLKFIFFSSPAADAFCEHYTRHLEASGGRYAVSCEDQAIQRVAPVCTSAYTEYDTPEGGKCTVSIGFSSTLPDSLKGIGGKELTSEAATSADCAIYAVFMSLFKDSRIANSLGKPLYSPILLSNMDVIQNVCDVCVCSGGKTGVCVGADIQLAPSVSTGNVYVECSSQQPDDIHAFEQLVKLSTPINTQGCCLYITKGDQSSNHHYILQSRTFGALQSAIKQTYKKSGSYVEHNLHFLGVVATAIIHEVKKMKQRKIS